MRRNQILGTCVLALATAFSTAQSEQQASNPSQPVVAALDATKVGAPISRYDYGMFIEHLGNIINHGLWSEMLDDRKFYFPVNSEPEKEPAGNPMRARFLRMKKWRPIGPDEVVVMDHEHAYVGEQSPQIRLNGSTLHGIQQSGLALRKREGIHGQNYSRGFAASKNCSQFGLGTRRERSPDNFDLTSSRHLREVPVEIHGAGRHR